MIGVLFVIGLPLLIAVLAFIFSDDSKDGAKMAWEVAWSGAKFLWTVMTTPVAEDDDWFGW